MILKLFVVVWIVGINRFVNGNCVLVVVSVLSFVKNFGVVVVVGLMWKI